MVNTENAVSCFPLLTPTQISSAYACNCIVLILRDNFFFCFYFTFLTQEAGNINPLQDFPGIPRCLAQGSQAAQGLLWPCNALRVPHEGSTSPVLQLPGAGAKAQGHAKVRSPRSPKLGHPAMLEGCEQALPELPRSMLVPLYGSLAAESGLTL